MEFAVAMGFFFGADNRFRSRSTAVFVFRRLVVAGPGSAYGQFAEPLQADLQKGN